MRHRKFIGCLVIQLAAGFIVYQRFGAKLEHEAFTVIVLPAVDGAELVAGGLVPKTVFIEIRFIVNEIIV